MFPWGMFPFFEQMKKQFGGQMNNEEIQKYVNDMMKNMMPGQWPNMKDQNQSEMHISPFPQSAMSENEGTPLKMQVFETFDYIFIRIIMETDDFPANIKISHTAVQAVIENLPEDGDRHAIPLPAPVKRKGTAAVIRDRILEIQLIKSPDTQVTEVNISGGI